MAREAHVLTNAGREEMRVLAGDGDGRLVVDVHQVYRLKETGELAYERNRRIHVTIRDDKVGRYEMEAIG